MMRNPLTSLLIALMCAVVACTALGVDVVLLDMTRPIALVNGVFQNVAVAAPTDYTEGSVSILKFDADLEIQPDASDLGTGTGVLLSAANRPTFTNDPTHGGGYYFDGGDGIDLFDKDVYSFGNGVTDTPGYAAVRYTPVDDTMDFIMGKGEAVSGFGEWHIAKYVTSGSVFPRQYSDLFRTSKYIGTLGGDLKFATTPSVTVIWTWDGSGSTNGWTVWTNGVLAAQPTAASGLPYTAMTNGTEACRIGRQENFSGAISIFQGYIWEARIGTNVNLSTTNAGLMYGGMKP